MNPTLKKYNHLCIPSFISHEHSLALFDDFFTLAQGDKLKSDKQAPNSPSIYNFEPFFRLLIEKTPTVSKILGESVLPTYSYARIYANGERLARHRDRDACEISVTLHLFGDYPWPIWFQRPDDTEVSITQTPGDAAMYLGCIADHWRDAYKGKHYAQVFLHYVRAKGPKAYTYFDKKREQN